MGAVQADARDEGPQARPIRPCVGESLRSSRMPRGAAVRPAPWYPHAPIAVAYVDAETPPGRRLASDAGRRIARLACPALGCGPRHLRQPQRPLLRPGIRRAPDASGGLVSREHAGFRTIGFFLPAFHLASAFALSKGHRSLAWAIITPFVGFLFWLGAVVVSQ